MTITEYIHHLEQLRNEVGDVEVETSAAYGRKTAPAPSKAYRYIRKKNESRERFADYYDADAHKGAVVVRV